MNVSPTPTKSASRSPFHRATPFRLQSALLLLLEGVPIQCCRRLLVRGVLTVDGGVIIDDADGSFIHNECEDDEVNDDGVEVAWCRQ